jgi:hypothetical protein
MGHVLTELTGNGTEVRPMTIAGDPIGCHASHGTARTEERFRGRQVSRLAQPHIDQMAIAQVKT